MVADLNLALRISDVEKIKSLINYLKVKVADKKTFDEVIAQGLLLDGFDNPKLPDLIEHCTTLENFGYLTEVGVPKWLESKAFLLKNPNILNLFLVVNPAVSKNMTERLQKGIKDSKIENGKRSIAAEFLL